MRAVPSSSWSSSSVPHQTSHWVLWIQFQVQIFSCISLPASALIHPPAQTPAKAFQMEFVRNQFSMISIFMNTPPIFPAREIQRVLTNFTKASASVLIYDRDAFSAVVMSWWAFSEGINALKWISKQMTNLL